MRQDRRPQSQASSFRKRPPSVGFYTLEGELVSTVPVGKHPHEMTLSADGRYAYVTDNGTMAIEQSGEGGNTVSIIDVAAREKVGEVDLGKYHRPHGIDVDPATGYVLVTTENPDRLLVIDPESRQVIRDYDTKGETSHIVTVSPDGKRAFVSNSRSANVAAIDLDSGEVTLIPAGQRPEGSVLSNDGKTLYVVNRDSNEITIIDTEKNENAGRIPTGQGPVRVGLTADGEYLVYALLTDKKVGFAEIATRKEVATVDLDGEPVSLHMSPDGKWALTAGQWADTVYVISVAERKIVRQFKTVQGAGPDPVVAVPGG